MADNSDEDDETDDTNLSISYEEVELCRYLAAMLSSIISTTTITIT